MAQQTFDDMVISTNATFSTILTYYAPDGATPINLTGFTAMMDVKATDGSVIVSLTTENGYLVLGASAGTITLEIPYTITSTLPAGTYSYDIVLVSGLVHLRLIYGSITVVQGVTP